MALGPSALGWFRRALRDARNADGGWGYQPGDASRLEPTCWALLALNEPATGVLTLLQSWPSDAGLLKDDAAGLINFAYNGLALTLLLGDPGAPLSPAVERLAAGLTRARGARLPTSTVNRQDNALQGWPWIAEEFSWIEPTAWCTLALRRWTDCRPDVEATRRVEEAERLFRDRRCASGGWNYGNGNMLGRQLPAYVPTTALALLALQRVHQPFVRQALDYLIARGTDERSRMALGLAVLGLHLHGAPVATVRTALERRLAMARSAGAVMPLAIALYALTIEEHDAAALRLGAS